MNNGKKSIGWAFLVDRVRAKGTIEGPKGEIAIYRVEDRQTGLQVKLDRGDERDLPMLL